MTATSIPVSSASVSGDMSGLNKLIAQFWHSPFAVAAASVIAAEFMLLAGKVYGGMDVSGDVLAALTFVAAGMLTAGTLPGWNCLTWDDRGFDQHAGLTHFHVDWTHVKSVSPVPGGLRISYVDQTGEKPVIKRGYLQNRYALDGKKFRQLIENQWLEKSALTA